MEIKSPDSKTCPITSGHEYVSPGAKDLVLTKVLESPAGSPDVTRLILNVAVDALMLVTTHLSMMVFTSDDVYSLVCDAGMNRAGMMF